MAAIEVVVEGMAATEVVVEEGMAATEEVVVEGMVEEVVLDTREGAALEEGKVGIRMVHHRPMLLAALVVEVAMVAAPRTDTRIGEVEADMVGEAVAMAAAAEIAALPEATEIQLAIGIVATVIVAAVIVVEAIVVEAIVVEAIETGMVVEVGATMITAPESDNMKATATMTRDRNGDIECRYGRVTVQRSRESFETKVYYYIGDGMLVGIVVLLSAIALLYLASPLKKRVRKVFATTKKIPAGHHLRRQQVKGPHYLNFAANERQDLQRDDTPWSVQMRKPSATRRA